MKNRLSWLAFPAAAFMGAMLCFLRNSGEPTISLTKENLSARTTAILSERTVPAAVEDSTPMLDADVTQALRSALLYSSGLHRRYELARIAERVGDQELPLLLQQCLEQPNAPYSDKLVLAQLWAERAPEAAAAFVAKKPENAWLSQAVARGWARRAPAAALEWVMNRSPEGRLEHLACIQEGSLESERPNPAEVMQAALQSYELSEQYTNAARVKLFTQWARHDARAVESFARGLADENQRQQGLLAVVSVLTETSPQKAIEFFKSIPMSQEVRDRAAVDFAAQLAAQDMTLATQFAQSQPEGPSRAGAVISIAKLMLEGSPEKARALIDNVPNLGTYIYGVHSFYEEWVKSDPATALVHYTQRLEKMDPSSEAYDNVQRMLGGMIDRRAPARETAEFLSGHMITNRQSQLTDVLQRWMVQDSVGAATWADALPSGSAREYALTGVAKGKTTQSITETVEWLGTLPKGPDYSAAVQGFASAVFSKDPDGALAWLKTIADPAERQRRLLEAWKQWATSSSTAEQRSNRFLAQQWRDSSPDLTPEERRTLVLPESK
ncbi:hypothetical protein ACXR0O_25920 [Verrucomicrobiota bacterium sgz303538]